jgi:hypothetical protein
MTQMRTTQRLKPNLVARRNDPVAAMLVEAADANRTHRRKRAARRMVNQALGLYHQSLLQRLSEDVSSFFEQVGAKAANQNDTARKH